jgi:hypothetical protein
MHLTARAMTHTFSTHSAQLYNGPDFDEYCVSESAYLPANRDRTPCLTCPLSNLCQAGFEEQARRAITGEETSLTKDCQMPLADLGPENLLAGLDGRQRAFVTQHVLAPEREK